MTQLNDCIIAAKKAGSEIMRYYDKNFSIKKKSDKSHVTDADYASNEILLKELPKIVVAPILSEESVDNPERLKSDIVWIVDPLDGTRMFIEKTGEFAVLIALAYNGTPRIGVSYEPTTKSCYFAELGKGSFVENEGDVKRLKTSNRTIQNMKSYIGISSHQELTLKMLNSIGINDITPGGGTAYKITRIASGNFDLYTHNKRDGGEWDTCALELILREAGGEFTDQDGKRVIYNKPKPEPCDFYIASNGQSHFEMISKIKDFFEKNEEYKRYR